MTEEIKTTEPAAKIKKVPVKNRTRTETVPKLGPGVELPAGYVPAYYRKRHGLLVLRTAEQKDYLVFSIKTGEFVSVRNTREASNLMAAIARGLKSLSTAA
jgi:hypothetical protein